MHEGWEERKEKLIKGENITTTLDGKQHSNADLFLRCTQREVVSVDFSWKTAYVFRTV